MKVYITRYIKWSNALAEGKDAGTMQYSITTGRIALTKDQIYFLQLTRRHRQSGL